MINELYALGQLAVAGIARGSVYALLAVSFSIVADTVRVWNFASAGVYAIVAYLVWYLVTNGLALPVGVALAFVVAAILMVGVDVTVHDPLRRRGATSEAMARPQMRCVVAITSLTEYPRALARLSAQLGRP